MILLRPITISDLKAYEYWKLPIHKYQKLNGPYFKKRTRDEVKAYIKRLNTIFQESIENPLPNRQLIVNESDKIIGEVSWYWKSEETLWMEIGIVIFDEKYWGKGIGFQAMNLWITQLFKTKKNIVRLGLTTWSGNIGMMKLSKKLGLKQEALYRKARIVNGVYYDSVSYGILREEWESI